MIKTNVSILDELDNDMVDCVNHSRLLFKTGAINGTMLNEVALALFRELQIKKWQIGMDDV